MKTKVKKVKQALFLHNKWIKIMLSLSIVAIIGLSVYPDQTAKRMVKSVSEMPETLKSIERLSPRLDTVGQPIPMESAVEEQPAVSSQEHLHVHIITEPQPFDWKGMISWVIGAVNGVVLLILNIKKIKTK